MIWIAASLLICTILICCTLLCIHLEKKAYSNAICCLVDLCDKLNDTFPGSTLEVTTDVSGIKVKGELKYLKNKE